MKILFLCSSNSCRSQMAEGFAKARRMKNITVTSAGTEATHVHPLAIKVMSEAGVDISSQKSKSLNDLKTLDFDVVISLCDQAARTCPILPGNPERVNWNLPDPTAGVDGKEEKILAAFRQLRDEIKRLVDDFFERGYLAALVESKRNAILILNNISDGVIAHDMKRRIFYFNRAAEEITGYRREDVINHDCHDVFPGNFCGGKCHFCDNAVPVDDDMIVQELDIVTKSGEKRFLNMTIRRMTSDKGHEAGILASFRDTTRERRLAQRVGEINSYSGIIGRDRKMQEIYDLIGELADSNVPVLIQGESGTGKELVAAAIHNEGTRGSKQFVPVNCGALPESLLESELFGHVKGAFTGAVRDKKGRFELADGGTIFLDEIGDISPTMQVKLLRVLQEGRFERVGSEKTVKVNVRVISATNKNIAEEIADGRFREDLYYRLSVVPMVLPPLRDRRNDIPLLVEYTLNRILKDLGRKNITISQETLDIMMSHHWPGNVRELQNWLQFALVKCRKGSIRPEHLPPAVPGLEKYIKRRRKRKLDTVSVRRALKETGNNRGKAAELLGVSRATLYRFLDDHA
ncbi:sigma 54-interacting transcriptional regulator [Verrucomicrobiota bacterium]